MEQQQAQNGLMTSVDHLRFAKTQLRSVPLRLVVQDALAAAKVHATLALAKEQRASNLIALHVATGDLDPLLRAQELMEV